MSSRSSSAGPLDLGKRNSSPLRFSLGGVAVDSFEKTLLKITAIGTRNAFRQGRLDDVWQNVTPNMPHWLSCSALGTRFRVGRLTVLKSYLVSAGISCASGLSGEASMNRTAARHEAGKILAELPDRISDVIKPFVRHSPDHPALVQGDVTWTYAELAAVVADTVVILKLYDIRPGDRVMIVSENSLALVALIFALSEIDAWSVVVNPRLSAREVDLIREHSGARRAFYTTEVSDAGRRHGERHAADIAVHRGLGTLAVGPLNRETVPEPVEAERSRQVAALVYTSGTTGSPKGVMLTHRNVLFSARVMGAQRGPTDKAYCVLPISHIVGYSGILIASLMAGATVQLVPRFDPAALVSAIANDGITLMFGVPATYQRLLEYKAVAGIEKLPRGRLRRLAV